jgi:hypothetical protein
MCKTRTLDLQGLSSLKKESLLIGLQAIIYNQILTTLLVLFIRLDQA